MSVYRNLLKSESISPPIVSDRTEWSPSHFDSNGFLSDSDVSSLYERFDVHSLWKSNGRWRIGNGCGLVQLSSHRSFLFRSILKNFAWLPKKFVIPSPWPRPPMYDEDFSASIGQSFPFVLGSVENVRLSDISFASFRQFRFSNIDRFVRNHSEKLLYSAIVGHG